MFYLFKFLIWFIVTGVVKNDTVSSLSYLSNIFLAFHFLIDNGLSKC